MTHLRLSTLILICLLSQSALATEGFSFDDKPGDHLDILLDGKIVARYMDGHDISTPARRTETFKPYLHIFDAEGKAPITQGADGKLFPHHRGIFMGWDKINANGKVYDRWHMKGGDMVHQKFIDRKATADSATVTSLIHWDGEAADKPIIIEERTFIFHRAPAPARLIVDFITKLKSTDGDILLDGTVEHAGVHFRPHGDIDAKQTSYFFPKENADAHKDLDLPWIASDFSVHGKNYSVAELNAPTNPKDTKISAYRDYGRFGFFPKTAIKAGEPLMLKYRFVIGEGPMLPVALIQKEWDEFAGVTTPTALPPTTLKPADVTGTPKPKAPAKKL